MRFRCGVVALAMWYVGSVLAAPPLTTIEDVIYKADGSRFNGVAFVEWKSFQASDFSTIATHSITAPIVNGVLRVQLVPTTTATPGAYYSVRYHSDGRIQFDEIWAVPPSAAILRLRDVRVATSTGGQVLPPAEQTLMQEADVVGLLDDLAARPLKGPGFAPGRTAYISEAGVLEGVAGSLTDCVRVDGTAGPCDISVSAGPGFVDGEIPAGQIDGFNAVFTLANAPTPPSSLTLFRNGVLQKEGLDYTLSGSQISFAAVSVPQPDDILTGSYRVAEASNPSGQVHTTPQVICSSTGSSTSSTSLTRLGSCTIPANLLQAGDRVEARFSYSHEGTAHGFTFEVRWGATAVVSRSGATTDARIAGVAEFGVYSGGTQWDVQSWGSTLAQAAAVGDAGDSLASALVVDLLGRFAENTADTLTLRNFTVVRYPAQANP